MPGWNCTRHGGSIMVWGVHSWNCLGSLERVPTSLNAVRWRQHLSPRPQFRYGTGREGNILQTPAPGFSAVTAHKTFGPTDLTSKYFLRTRRVFGGIGHRTQAFWSGVRFSNR
ncbi:hypothetical protein TNCV_4618401 [Trichonephila clavipes]|nr:hypothetical protein TNCV_4618401 [Trichonephila clavipes]